VCWQIGECFGDSLGNRVAEDEDACKDACKEFAQCGWFTYDSSDGLCLLYSNCADVDNSCPTCTTGQPLCGPRNGNRKEMVLKFTIPSLALTKVIVIGGGDHDGIVHQSVEVINLANDEKSCPSVPDYPTPIREVTAAYYQGKVVACGGYNGEEFTPKCYELSSDLNEWLPMQSLPDTRFFGQTLKSSVIDDTWVLSGGDEFSTGVFAYDGIFSPLPSLPEGFSDHCQLTVNEKFIFFSGSAHKRDTFLLNWETQEYIQLDKIPEEVNYPACGILNNPFEGLEFLVATGADAFIFSLKDLSWREARVFPVRARFPSKCGC